MNIIDDFYKIAVDFCKYVNDNEISESSVDVLISYLMKLYLFALKLPDMEPDSDESERSVIKVSIPIQVNDNFQTMYWEVFNPLEEDEPVCGYLVDDLNDIINDIQRGIHEYESGRTGNAVFEWKNGLDSHWGNHAIDAIRALHAIRCGL